MAPKIQHKRSAVAGKAPLPADLDYGEIGVNYEASDPALYIKDTANAVRKIGSQPDASETTKGIVELATAAETTTGTDNTRAVHPAGLKVELDKKAPLASPALTGVPTAPTAAAGTNTTQVATTEFVTAAVAVENLWDRTGTVVSPTNAGDTVAVQAATETVAGIAEIATQAEVNAGTDDSRIVTPAKLKTYVTDQLKATWLPGDHIPADGVGTSTWNGTADTLTATGAVEVKVAAGTWGTGGAVAPAEQVQVRWKAGDVSSAAHGATLTGRVQNASGNVGVDYSTTVDKLPGAITIPAGTNAAPSAPIDSSASSAVTGITAAVRLWLKSSNGTTPQVNIAGGTWVNIPTTPATGLAIAAGQTFQLRHTTQAGANTVTTTDVYVGWDVASSVVASYATTNAAVPPLKQATATTIAGAAEIGSTLTATPGTASGGTPAITYATRWQSSADGTSGWADIAGATGLTYVVKAGDLNSYIRAVTTATDATTPTAQTLELPSASSAKVTAPVAVTLGWNADTDVYVRDPAANRIIDVHSRIRRCLLTDAGVVTYLDADNSTKLAGDWLRLVETTELNTPYTGTHGAEVANTALRAGATAWAAGTYTKGQRVTHSGSVWECLAATTTATPAAGTANATLDGSSAQVMVEIPRFSVKHETAAAGSHQQHTFHLTRGTKTDSGYAVHPAFVKPDGSFRDFIYVGAYQGTGTSGNGSASGVNNAVNFTRAACRTACSGRGAGWHQLGYWENNALQWLLITEYQDMNSQRVLGNGATAGSVYAVPTGLSNARGNRCGNAHTPAGASTDYVSYRGVENFYGRAWQWIDGININERNVYLCADPSKWKDDTNAGYTANGTVPVGGGEYQRDVMTGIALLPSSLTGASGTTFVGDALWTSSGWRVAVVGSDAHYGAQVGALCVDLASASSVAYTRVGGRLAYAA